MRLSFQNILRIGIELVLCTEEIDDHWKNAFTHYGILAVQYVEPSDANFICHVAAVQPIHSLTADVCHDIQICSCAKAAPKAMKIGRVKSFRQIILGNKYHIVLEDFVHLTRVNKVVAAQLLLRAPSEGIAEQYRQSLRRMISSLKCWFYTKRNSKYTPGSTDGFPLYFDAPSRFEARMRCWLHHIDFWLQNGAQNIEDFKDRFWMTENSSSNLYKQILHSCTSNESDLRYAFKALLGGYGSFFNALKTHGLQRHKGNFNEEFVFDVSKDTAIQPMMKGVIIESFGTKVTVLDQLLSSWYQLLKIDRIVSSNCKISNAADESTDSSDDEYAAC